MTLRALSLRGVAILVPALMSACSLMPGLQLPAASLPERFPEESLTPTSQTIAAASTDTASGANAVPSNVSVATPDRQWWRLFEDPVLNRLVEQTLGNSPDIALLSARLEEAQATAREAAALQYPEIDGSFNGARTQYSTLSSTPIAPGYAIIRNDFRLALSTAFELDFFGKLRSAAQGARANLLATSYANDTAVLSLVASVAQSYFLLRSLDQQIQSTQQTLVSREKALDLVKRRAGGGIASSLEVNQAEGARAQAAVQLRDLSFQRAQAGHLLALLTGQTTLVLPQETSSTDITAPPALSVPILPEPPAGLPSGLLARRPDIAQAEQNIIVSNARIGVARANLYPSISLTSSVGGESQALSDITKPGAQIFSLGFGLTLPIFEAGRLRARADAAVAVQQQAVATYQKTLQTAFREVQDALAAQRERGLAQADSQIRVDAAREALRIAQVRYDEGYSPYLDVLDAQRTFNDAQIAYLQNVYARQQASIDLMKALGGGWVKPH